ncbi:hypothetical protein [Nodularia sp. LEGE 06071]
MSSDVSCQQLVVCADKQPVFTPRVVTSLSLYWGVAGFEAGDTFC